MGRVGNRSASRSLQQLPVVLLHIAKRAGLAVHVVFRVDNSVGSGVINNYPALLDER